MKTYGQYCPIARASEILAQRWTPIIIRNLLNGPATYTDLVGGAPGIPRSLLTGRLRELAAAGIVEHSELDGVGRYALSRSGEDLATVVNTIGEWGERWLEVTPQQADPVYFLNSWIDTYLARDLLPERRVVVRFDLLDQPAKVNPMWVIFDREHPEVCRTDPGYDVDLVVAGESVGLAEWHLGRVEWADLLRDERIEVRGRPSLARALPRWNRRSRWVKSEHLVG